MITLKEVLPRSLESKFFFKPYTFVDESTFCPHETSESAHRNRILLKPFFRVPFSPKWFNVWSTRIQITKYAVSKMPVWTRPQTKFLQSKLPAVFLRTVIRTKRKGASIMKTKSIKKLNEVLNIEGYRLKVTIK